MPAKGEARLGAASDNDLVLPWPGVSRHHARLEATAEGVLLEDLGSKNGLWVGGRRLERVELKPGDRVGLGRAVLTLEEVSSTDVSLALELESGRAGGSGAPGAGFARSETAPVSVLRLVRDLETLGPSLSQERRSELLSRVVDEVGASALWVFAPVDGDLFLRDVVGTLPEADDAERVASTLGDRRDGEPLRLDLEAGRWTLICPSASDGGLAVVAAFPRRREPPDAWVTELVSYVGEKVRVAEGPESGRRPPRRHEELVLPEAMVVGESPAMRGLLEHLRAAARSDLHVLLLGETGVGKELVARALHESSRASDGPFVAISCAAIPEELLEAELFGVAVRIAAGVDPRPGRFRQAAGGTIFLDEVGELADALQAKLLRVLQEREVWPLGGDRPRKIEARVVAASNLALDELVRDGRFRSDLYYRLSGLELHVPPLRDRLEDLPRLVLHFASRAAEKYGKRIAGVSRRALTLLMAYEWPGNVRELENSVVRAVLLADPGGALESGHFGSVRWAVERGQQGEPPFARYATSVPPVGEAGARSESSPESFRPLQERLDAVEIRALREALTLAHGDEAQAAELLGVSTKSLLTKLRRHGLG